MKPFHQPLFEEIESCTGLQHEHKAAALFEKQTPIKMPESESEVRDVCVPFTWRFDWISQSVI